MKSRMLLTLSTLLLTTSLYSATLGKDVKKSSLIVYNSNIALVHEERSLELTEDDTQIIYSGVAKSVQTDSINVSLPKGVTLNSQQYRFDKLTLQKLLDAYIGKKVEVRLLKNRNEFKIITVTLLSSSGTKSLVRTLDFKILSVDSSAIMFEEIPPELITKPSLVWNINAEEYTKADMKLDYLVSGISFKSDYILTLGEKSAKLTGWLTLNNRSGKSFKQTKLSLLAGDINRVTPMHRANRMLKSMSVANTQTAVAHKAFEGYHFYTIPFKVDIANNEKTQIKFVDEANLTVERFYSARLTTPHYLQGEQKNDVEQFIKIAPLAIALPKGVVRTYAPLQGQTILLAETNLAHTAKNSPIKLKLGKNFDIKVTQTLLSRQNSENSYDTDILYSVENSSDESKNVTLLIPFNRNLDSKVTAALEYSFTEGNLVTFSLHIPANSTKKFKVNYESSK